LKAIINVNKFLEIFAARVKGMKMGAGPMQGAAGWSRQRVRPETFGRTYAERIADGALPV
jgi:hypothetical protein